MDARWRLRCGVLLRWVAFTTDDKVVGSRTKLDMKLSIEPATRILRRTVGRSYIAPLACVVTLVTSGCSQRYEWRDHYVDPPASPKPKPKPSPKPVDSSEPTNGSGETSASIVSSDDAGLDATVVATGDAGRDAEAPLVEGAPL